MVRGEMTAADVAAEGGIVVAEDDASEMGAVVTQRGVGAREWRAGARERARWKRHRADR